MPTLSGPYVTNYRGVRPGGDNGGGTVLRITQVDGTVADHDLARLIGRGGVFATFTAETIADARLIDGTVGWIIDDVVVDLAPDGVWEHTRGRCGGGGCAGWDPDQTRVVALPTSKSSIRSSPPGHASPPMSATVPARGEPR